MARSKMTLVITLLLLGPVQLRGQVFGGVFGILVQDSCGESGESSGVGVEGGLNIPVLPLDVFGSAEWFFPNCARRDLRGWSLGFNYRVLPVPLVSPYVTGGRTWRRSENGEPPGSGEGMFGGIGIDVSLPGFGLFTEIRYEFLSGDLAQTVMRAGFLLSWGGLPL